MAWTPLPTLYKARGVPTKQVVCAICVDRTRGRTQRLRLTHRVSVHLCDAHASAEFQRRRGGRDFVRTLMGVWRANDCLTLARSRALDAHLQRMAGPPAQRARPGSYSWPALRRRVERAYADGVTPAAVTHEVQARYADAPATLPAGERSSAGTHSSAGSLVRRSGAMPPAGCSG
jgi:hypothetical protein